MGEKHADIIDVAKRLRALKAEAIPVNFFLPIAGNDFCLPRVSFDPGFYFKGFVFVQIFKPFGGNPDSRRTGVIFAVFGSDGFVSGEFFVFARVFKC